MSLPKMGTLSFVPNKRHFKKFWSHITKLVVIDRGEALNPNILFTHLGFEYLNVHDGDCRGFTVKTTVIFVDECWTLFNFSKERL